MSIAALFFYSHLKTLNYKYRIFIDSIFKLRGFRGKRLSFDSAHLSASLLGGNGRHTERSRSVINIESPMHHVILININIM